MRQLRPLVAHSYRMALRPFIHVITRRFDGPAQPLANALAATLRNDITTEEKAWIARIASLREELVSSSAEISIVDYGAGSPDLSPTDAEMYRGKVVTRTVGAVCRSGSKSHFWALLLFKLIREYRPTTCLELGTCLGISAAYQAAALKLNQGGRLVTLEGASSLASLAERHLEALGLDNVSVAVGRFRDTLPKVLHQLRPIDYAFIDGHHAENATLAYFSEIAPFLSDRAVLVLDDISWSEGMRRAWKAIEADKMVRTSVDLQRMGICMFDSRAQGKRCFRVPMV